MSKVVNVRAEILELPEINTIPGNSQFYVLNGEGPSARVSFDSLTDQIKSQVEDVAVRLKLDLATLQGLDGSDGEGVPVGGSAGQILAKIDGVDFNTEWIDLPQASGPSLPVGGLTGQILAKASDNDGEAVWVDPPQDGADGAPGPPGADAPQAAGTASTVQATDGLGNLVSTFAVAPNIDGPDSTTVFQVFRPDGVTSVFRLAKRDGGSINMGVSRWMTIDRDGLGQLQIGNAGGLPAIHAFDSLPMEIKSRKSGSGTGVTIYNDDASCDEVFRVGVGATSATASQLLAVRPDGRLIHAPPPIVTLPDNSTLAFEATSNTEIKIVYRGSDGVTRKGSIPLV